MSAARWRAMAERMLGGNGGSTVQWTRRTFTVDGPAGTSTEGTPATSSVRAAQLSEESHALSSSQSWQTASVRLIVSAAGLPFTAETYSGSPEVRFEDTVLWLGKNMRVTSIDAWAAPGGPGAPPQLLAFFVSLSN